jgi:hypothetical protein
LEPLPGRHVGEDRRDLPARALTGTRCEARELQSAKPALYVAREKADLEAGAVTVDLVGRGNLKAPQRSERVGGHAGQIEARHVAILAAEDAESQTGDGLVLIDPLRGICERKLDPRSGVRFRRARDTDCEGSREKNEDSARR